MKIHISLGLYVVRSTGNMSSVGNLCNNNNMYKDVDFYSQRALFGFDRWQSINKGLPLESVKNIIIGIISDVAPAEWRSCLMGSAHQVLGDLLVFSKHECLV